MEERDPFCETREEREERRKVFPFVAFPPPSVVGDNGQSAQLIQLGLVLPLPLLVRQPRLVYLLCQLAEDLVHFCEVHHLRGTRRGRERWLFHLLSW